jgi:hypothetical protein
MISAADLQKRDLNFESPGRFHDPSEQQTADAPAAILFTNSDVVDVQLARRFTSDDITRYSLVFDDRRCGQTRGQHQIAVSAL